MGDQDLFTAIQEMIAALRSEVEQTIDAVFLQATPFETQRVAFMRQTLARCSGRGFSEDRRSLRGLACAGFSQPVRQPRTTRKRLKGLPRSSGGRLGSWSYGRLSWESGYGAGIELPGW